MSSVEEKIKELEDAYKARYGENCIVNVQDNGRIKNTPYHHFQLWYRNDEGVIQCNSDIYLYVDEQGNAGWFNRNPCNLPPKPSATPTFTEKLQDKIRELVNSGAILYGEILTSDDTTKRARVFIKDETKEAVYVVGMDEKGNLTKKETSFTVKV